MDEKSMLEQIRQSADKIEVPDALKPDAIEKKLREEQKKNAVSKTGSAKKSGGRKWSRYARLGGSIAAALALCICAGAIFAAANGKFGYRKDIAELPADHAKNPNIEMAEEVREEDKERTLGNAYYLAEDYGTVYDRIPEWTEDEMWFGNTDEKYNDTTNGAMNPGAAEESAESSRPESDMDSAREVGDYSTTNVQTAGVDESDIVKTDGDYIYTLRGNKVVITDIRNNALTETGTIAPSMKSASDTVREMYVDGDKLLLIMERDVSALQTGEEGSLAPGSAASAGDVTSDSRAMCTDDVYYMDLKYETCVLTYDISNRSKAKLLGEMVQDGSYRSSRKIGDKVYLFTNYRIEDTRLSRKEALYEERLDEWLPSAADKVVNADCIYLGEEGQNGIFMASMDVDEPDTVIDSKLVVDYYAELYVSASAVYLYKNEYTNHSVTTIAKFELQDNGIIHAVNAATVKGYITDTFGINEADGYLRVLTTAWDENGDTNHLTVLGKNMEYVSSINDIAPGEQIYAARFLGDIGYFVTYRNTDPLFTVDLSNHFEPKIIGELKVTGFSEYLHFWDETHLIGIGFETDPETGNRNGVKLSMFDISDPANVTEEARYVIDGEDDSSAMWNYKSVLISKDKNLIGFVTEDYNLQDEVTYRAFSYENGAFTEELSVSSPDEQNNSWSVLNDSRSLYSGNTLYLIVNGEIAAYDMEHGYTKVE